LLYLYKLIRLSPCVQNYGAIHTNRRN